MGEVKAESLWSPGYKAQKSIWMSSSELEGRDQEIGPHTSPSLD